MERLKGVKKTLIFCGEEIMSVYELSKNQLIELKQNYLCEVQKNVSYGELCDADNIISDEEIFQTYSCTDFSLEDFMCA